MAASLEQLLVERTKADEYTSLLSVLQSNGFPVSDYLTGGAAKITLEALAFIVADLSKLIPTVAKGGYAALAKDLHDPTWLDLIAEYWYDLQRVKATFTKQRCLVSCTAGLGPQTVQPGFVARAPATGNRYIFQGSPTVIPDGSSAPVELTAENAGAHYADPAGTIIEIVTPLNGLSITNPNQTFGGTDAAGAAKKNAANHGSGTVTPSGSPIQTRFYTVTVVASGAAGASGSVKVEYEQGGVKTTLPTQSPIPAVYAGAGDGVSLAFADGAGAGFIIGDIHTFQTPGTPITANGTDDETNASLFTRCIGRWPSLSLNTVADKYKSWVRQASIENFYGIEKVTVRPSSTVAGQADILVATGTGAAVSGGTVTALQNYINARDGVVDSAEVKPAGTVNVTPSGTVTVRAGELTAVQTAADENWRKYITALDIGGDTKSGTPGVVRLAELVQAVMDAGAVDFSGAQLNGAAVNLQLLSDKVAVMLVAPSAGLTWLTVA